jgi:geranylgeranyl pyrophosphate synthase
MSAAEQIFGAGGKRMRPALVFLLSRATVEVVGLKEVLSSILRAFYGAEGNRKSILHFCFAGILQLNISV